jgi:hypothetical protein
MMHFDFRTYFRMLRLALRERDPRGRRLALFATLFLIPVVSTLHAVCFLLDRILFPKLGRVEVKAPVFIIGHARGGTTLMHRLMVSDGDRFSYFLAYEMFFPSLLEKKLIRLLGRIDRRVLGSRIERALTAREDRTLAATRDVHDTGLSSPEEDDFVLTFSCASGLWIVFFPYLRELDFYHVDERPPRRRRRLLRFYRDCVRRQLYLNGPHKIHCSKNPTFSGRVESLIETFPDARFVLLVRDPREAIPSLLKMLQGSYHRIGWGDERVRESLEILAEMSLHTYRYPFEVLHRHPETRWAIVDYRDLVASPKRAVQEVYAKLGIEMTPAFAAVLEEREKRARAHATSHRYSLDEFGIDPDRLRAELPELFDRFGWDREDAGKREV